MFKNILKFAGLILIVTMFFSCEEDSGEEMSISERIDAFETSLNNGDYTNIADHFHPDMTSYDTYQDGSLLNTGLLASTRSPFTFGAPTTADNGDGTYSAEGSFSNSEGAGTYDAEMKEDGDNNWKILEMNITVGASTLPIQGISR